MSNKTMKLVTVSPNGQISIGKSWAGKQIRVEEVNDNEIHISSGVFVPDSHKTFFTTSAKESLKEFNKFEANTPAKATDIHTLFANLKKKRDR